MFDPPVDLHSSEAAQEIGNQVMRLLDRTREEFPEGEGWAVDTCLVVLAMQNDEEAQVVYLGEDERPWIQKGLLHGALRAEADDDD